MTDTSRTGLSGRSDALSKEERFPVRPPCEEIPAPDLVRLFDAAFPEAEEAARDPVAAAARVEGTGAAPDNGGLGEEAFSEVARPERERRDSPETVLGMSHPLNALFPSPPETVHENPAPRASADRAWAAQLAERILVGHNAAGEQEVRIAVNAEIVPDTEVSLVRRTDGSLSATLISNDPAAFQTLVAGQADLRARLERMAGTPVQVMVRSGRDGDDEDARRRSRGLAAPHMESRE